MISFDLDEIFDLSDRILVIYQGKIVGDFPSGKVTRSECGLLMGGKIASGSKGSRSVSSCWRMRGTLVTVLTSVAAVAVALAGGRDLHPALAAKSDRGVSRAARRRVR